MQLAPTWRCIQKNEEGRDRFKNISIDGPGTSGVRSPTKRPLSTCSKSIDGFEEML